MKCNIKINLSNIEKTIMIIYSLIIIFVKIIYDKFLLVPIILMIIIYFTAKRRNKNNDTNYLIKERFELIIRHFFLLSIFWNITISGVMDILGENDLIDIVLYTFSLIICILPFIGILKAISKIQKIDINKNVQLYRELPQNIEPAIIAYLLQEKLSDKSDISATLLDLVRREYLIIEDEINNNFEEISKGILGKNLIINKKKTLSDLKKYERYLINWFLRVSKSSDKIKLSELKNNLKESETFKEDFNSWEKLIKEEADKIDFYNSDTKLSKFSRMSTKIVKKLVVVSILAFCFFFVGFYLEGIITSDIFIISVVCAFFIHIIFAILAIIIYNLRLPTEYLNELGKENVKKWNGFIEFLKEYTLINTRQAEEIALWQEYLVYGVAFGVATKVINDMNKAYGFDTYVDKY